MRKTIKLTDPKELLLAFLIDWLERAQKPAFSKRWQSGICHAFQLWLRDGKVPLNVRWDAVEFLEAELTKLCDNGKFSGHPFNDVMDDYFREADNFEIAKNPKRMSWVRHYIATGESIKVWEIQQ